jgi:hypothetical protein
MIQGIITTNKRTESMLVIQIVVILLIILISVLSVTKFNDYCARTFDYCFLTLKSFVIVGASILLIYYGNEWWLSAITNDNDQLNGILLIAIGSIIAIYQLQQNFRETNIIYGFIGSVIQLSIFIILAYIGSIILIAGLIASLFLGLTATRVSSI